MTTTEEQNTEPAERATSHKPLKAAALGCGVMAALPVLLVLGVVALVMFESAVPEDYAEVAPEKMAERVVSTSEDAYRAMGLHRAIPRGEQRTEAGGRTVNRLDSGLCYPGGWESLEDRSVKGAYQLSHDWELDRVPAKAALPALERLRDHLKDTGWRVTRYGKSVNDEWEVDAERDGDTSDDGVVRQSVTWFENGQRLHGGNTGPCAYEPGWKEDDGPPGRPVEAPAVFPAP
ncbi:hypothetical protein ACH4GK_21085 [Streptomyces rimosus]|uniref:hypothetical protein n=1 Tax=Streptomyces rimosus TaxID=1927 RepID=UPI00131CD4DB|nr:hypothetical protein [Streptomyces rimosus]